MGLLYSTFYAGYAVEDFPNETEIRVRLGGIQTRLNLIKNQKSNALRTIRSELVKYLQQKNLEMCKYQMSKILTEENLIENINVLIDTIVILKEKVFFLYTKEVCPDKVVSQLETLIYSSKKIECEELTKFIEILTIKFGKQFIENAFINFSGRVNVNVIARFTNNFNDKYLCLKVREFCKNNHLKFDFNIDLDENVLDDANLQFNKEANLFENLKIDPEGWVYVPDSLYYPNGWVGISNPIENKYEKKGKNFNEWVHYNYDDDMKRIGNKNIANEFEQVNMPKKEEKKEEIKIIENSKKIDNDIIIIDDKLKASLQEESKKEFEFNSEIKLSLQGGEELDDEIKRIIKEEEKKILLNKVNQSSISIVKKSENKPISEDNKSLKDKKEDNKSLEALEEKKDNLREEIIIASEEEKKEDDIIKDDKLKDSKEEKKINDFEIINEEKKEEEISDIKTDIKKEELIKDIKKEEIIVKKEDDENDVKSDIKIEENKKEDDEENDIKNVLIKGIIEESKEESPINSIEKKEDNKNSIVKENSLEKNNSKDNNLKTSSNKKDNDDDEFLC